jgi:hypothetical protein
VQGQVATFDVELTAEGIIGCFTSPSAPSTATFDTVYSIVGGSATPSTPGRAHPYYANGGLVLLPPFGCAVSWDGAPAPYRFSIDVAAAPDTPPGNYELLLASRVSNNSGTLFSPLEDRQAEPVTVVVEEPPPAPVPAELPPPFENQSINLLPREPARITYPGVGGSLTVTEPLQIPPGTRVTPSGFVDLISDREGSGVPQGVTLWEGTSARVNDPAGGVTFRVDYTRRVDPRPGGSPRRADRPITELRLVGRLGRGATGARAEAARRRSRGLWARGRGRFRTRGRYGAGTVRGTHWLTLPTPEGELFRVTSGLVNVSDFTIGRSFLIRGGQSYLAQPPGRGGSRG